MPTRVSTFTNANLSQLLSAAAWNQWVDSWNTWFAFLTSVGHSSTTALTHGAAGGAALPRATVVQLQTNLNILIPEFFQDVSPVDAAQFWPNHTGATARAAAGLSGTTWTRQWFRRVANTTSATSYTDGSAFVSGDLVWNMADGRVYLRGASSWTLQPRNTFPTVKTGEGTAQAYDIITSTLFNELAAVHQVLYYRNGNYLSNPTPPNYLYTDDGGKLGESPSDNPPTSTGDTVDTTAEGHADAAWAAAAGVFSDTTANGGDNNKESVGTVGLSPQAYTTLSHNWTDAGHPWWKATRSTWPRKYGGNWSAAAPTGLTVELWAKIVRVWNTSTYGTRDVPALEYDGPYAENSIQPLGTVTRGGGGATGYIHVDLGNGGSYPADVPANAYPTQNSAVRGCTTTRSQTRVDLRPVMPAP